MSLKLLAKLFRFQNGIWFLNMDQSEGVGPPLGAARFSPPHVGGTIRLIVFLVLAGAAIPTRADNLDTIGITLLRQMDPTLNGNGINIGQVEGSTSGSDPNVFEAIPGLIGCPTNLFTYYSLLGTAGGYPNSVGSGSSHATSVGGILYGATGVATNAARVDNYEAGYFLNSWISPSLGIPAQIVNQSVLFNVANQSLVDSAYDNYAVAHNTLFVNGAGNSGSISTNPPATMFNGITVGVYPGTSSLGPTSDGRCKPDITSPGSGATSFSTPHVAGCAAILLQAARRGDGGAGTINIATNPITLKALLLNGAVQPADWTNGVTTPLDARYGAGVVNAFNSWEQLRAGQHAAIETTTLSRGAAHPPGTNMGNEVSTRGWDYSTLTTLTSQDQVSHYYFALTGGVYTATATLVWIRLQNRSKVNNLDLFLFNADSGNLVLSSTSVVDNVEHLFLPELPPGRYDLQVLKHGSGQVTTGETYALAFEFFSMHLDIALTSGKAELSWPISPTGFRLVSTTNLVSTATWTTVQNAVADVPNNRNVAIVTLTGTKQFFRLQRP